MLQNMMGELEGTDAIVTAKQTWCCQAARLACIDVKIGNHGLGVHAAGKDVHKGECAAGQLHVDDRERDSAVQREHLGARHARPDVPHEDGDCAAELVLQWRPELDAPCEQHPAQSQQQGKLPTTWVDCLQHLLLMDESWCATAGLPCAHSLAGSSI